MGYVQDSTDTPTGYALVNGRRSVYLLVTKRADASTLSVVKRVKAALPDMQAVLPPDIRVRYEFDQSPYVTRAIWGVVVEGASGAVLVGLMVLLFLRDWRSAIVVLLNIPLALMAAVVALWLSGQTINLMTLGGLALAIGILVDEATVEVENIHSQMAHAPSIARAVRLGNAQTAIPRFLAMVCILAVFISSFFMQGCAAGDVRALVAGRRLLDGGLLYPVEHLRAGALGVAAASRAAGRHWRRATFGRIRRWIAVALPSPVPRSGGSAGPKHGCPLGSSDSPSSVSAADMKTCNSHCRLGRLVAAYLVAVRGDHLRAGQPAGHGNLPHRRYGPIPPPRAGPRAERTSAGPNRSSCKVLDVIKETAGPDNVELTLAYLGTIGSAYPINTVYQWMRGPEDAIVRVALQSPQRHPHGAIRRRSFAAGLAEALPDVQLSFEPADIINEVMSFGSRHAGRSGRERAGFRRDSALRRQAPRRVGQDPGAAGPSDRPIARLSHDPDRRGPREGRDGARYAGRRGPVVGRGHLVQPLHGAQLLGRPRRRASAIRCRWKCRGG